jgi:isopentenyl-diphosphate delta-isomerase
VDICLRDEVLNTRNYWDDVHLVHAALPEVDLDTVDMGVELFGKGLGAPLVIASMTGGHAHGRTINANLAAAAAELRLPMGVGSQRPALEHPDYGATYEPIKEHDVPLVIANVGAPQLVDQRSGRALGLKEVRKVMEMIDADLVAIHLNFLQEIAQPQGDTRATGVLEAIAEIASEVPVIAKETGAGISRSVAQELKEAGVVALDVGGAGGTSFAAVEAIRAEERDLPTEARVGWTLKDWGAEVGLPIIATGGIRSGLDAARALVLGASAAGVARRVLEPAIQGPEETVEELRLLIEELRAVMFLTGSGNVNELQAQEFVLSGQLLDWLGSFEVEE